MTTPSSGIAVDDLTVRRGGRTIFADLGFELGPGVHVVRGPNGTGKSTLLRTLAGVVPLSRGVVRLCGIDLQRDPDGAKALLGWLPDGADLFPDLRPTELLETVAVLRGTDDLQALIDGFDLGRCLDHRMHQLSYGQRRKVALIAALIGSPRVLLLDEPDDGLDIQALDILRARLHAQAERACILVATHRDPPVPATSEMTLAAVPA